MIYDFKLETIKESTSGLIQRTKVPGGWIVYTTTRFTKKQNGLDQICMTSTYVPDPLCDWEL